MKKEQKGIKYSFSIFLLVMNSVFMGLELDRLFRLEQNRKTYGTSSTISESAALEMQNVSQLRELIQSWTVLISVVLFVLLVYRFSDQVYRFFYASIILNIFFSLIALTISIVFPFHIIEVISPLSLSLLMSVTLGMICFLKILKQKYLVSEL